MKTRIIIGIVALSLSGLQSACTPKSMSLEKRKKIQAKRKKHNPDDCPQIDCD